MWGLLVFVFASLFHLSEPFSPFTYMDKYLKGSQLRVIQVEDWYECIKQCQEELLCISYNFDNKSECQLNGHGVEKRCQAEDELTSSAGWIYHQIREVTRKTTRGKNQGSCPCNCGVSKQCYVEPEYGDVPEKAGSSCQDILNRRGSVPDRAYYLMGATKPVYCHMTSISGCGDVGGWTLVMKINGSKSTFRYNSQYWTSKMPSKKEYQPENGANLDEKETKLATFSSIAFQNICVGMKLVNFSSIRWLNKKISSGKSMMTIAESGYVTFGYDEAKWLKLLPGSKLDNGTKRDGFNVRPSSGDGARVRIGIIAYPKSDNAGVPISYIGFGAGGDAAASKHMGRLSCGNVNGMHYIPAFGYIFVK
ncbi:uncharacterized protein LOC116291655 [Actinia tenebrosa]|uniref:Uncharacterized protein LOC116291655 n=1 Tax=Actinia tenebrosa TaxID=6105 RepID=A0A6P8HFW2_ACTTE|nr:uncharacterized protein LOC116291655 [Actinia tenebrosa]